MRSRRKGERARGLFEQIITENFPNLGKKLTFESRRHRESTSNSTEIDQHLNTLYQSFQITKIKKKF